MGPIPATALPLGGGVGASTLGEGGHGDASVLVDAVAAEYHRDGSGDDRQVEPEGRRARDPAMKGASEEAPKSRTRSARWRRTKRRNEGRLRGGAEATELMVVDMLVSAPQ